MGGSCFLSPSWLWVGVLGAVLGGCTPAHAQSCSRDCPIEQKDARGCCPAPPSKPKTSPSAPPKTPTPGTLGQAPTTAGCAVGLVASTDTFDRCCWPGQGWTGTACVGEPSACPAGHDATPNGCELRACADGMSRMLDGVNCCWPGQAWLPSRGACVGPIQCPTGFVADGDAACISQGAAEAREAAAREAAAVRAAEARAAEARAAEARAAETPTIAVPGVGFGGLVVGNSTPEDVLRVFGADCKVDRRSERGEIWRIDYDYNGQGVYDPGRAGSVRRPSGFHFENGLLTKIFFGAYQTDVKLHRSLSVDSTLSDVLRELGEPSRIEWARPDLFDRYSDPLHTYFFPGLGIYIDRKTREVNSFFIVSK